MNDRLLLEFVLLALKDPEHVKDRISLIDVTCQYGKRYDVTKEDVDKILDKKLIEFL